MQISNRISAVCESGSLKMAARCQEMRRQGVDVVSMTLGEPDFAAPEHVKQAAIKAVADDWSHYGPVPGYPSLREAIAGTLDGRYQANEIMVSTGAKQVIYNAIMVTINKGDEVVIPTPCWVSYMEIVKLAEGVPVTVPTTAETNWKVTAEQLEAALNERTKMVMLCSPNNPTGSVYSRAELEALITILERFPDVWILSDEIYQHINYIREVVSLADFENIRERLILVNGISKAYAMTGYRIGWMATKSRDLWQAYNRLQGQSTTCACTVAQKAAEVAYLAPQDCVEQMRLAFERRRDLIMELVREWPDVTCTCPEGAFYIFPDVSAYYPHLAKRLGSVSAASREMTEYLLNEAHVACVAGADFGEDRCIRLSYATDESTIREAMKRIAEALKRI